MWAKATACFFFVSRYTRSLIFPNFAKKKKTHEKNTKCNVLRSCAFARYRARFATHWVVFVFPLPFGCMQKLQSCRTFALSKLIQRQIFSRGKWGSGRKNFTLFSVSWPKTGATSIARCQIMQRWLGDWSWGHPGSAAVGGWSWLMKLRVFFFFSKFCVFLISLPHWFFSSM